MKLPTNFNKVSLNSKLEIGVYPPNGFLQFEEANLGNGDHFGLYWEFGQEENDTIVCEMIHDERIICPWFSSLNKFLECWLINSVSNGCL